MLADSVPQPPQGSNCEWSLTRGAVHASREGRLEVVNNHYPVKSSFSVLNMSNCSLPTGCQGCKSSTSCKTFRKKKDIVWKAQRNRAGKGVFLRHCASSLTCAESKVTAGAVWQLSIHSESCRSVCACVCVLVRGEAVDRYDRADLHVLPERVCGPVLPVITWAASSPGTPA